MRALNLKTKYHVNAIYFVAPLLRKVFYGLKNVQGPHRLEA